MEKDFLSDRRNALEGSFFAKEDQRLIDELRKKTEQKERKKALSEVSGLQDEAVLDHLVKLGIAPETLMAFSLIPLVVVAWADRNVDEKEREAILKAAAELNINEGSAGQAMLEQWLDKEPEAELVDTWKAYVAGLKAEMEASSLAELKKNTIDRARNVAESAGGFLGLGQKVSSVEQKVLDDLAKAFD